MPGGIIEGAGGLLQALGAGGMIAGGLGFVRWLMTRHADAVTEFRKALDRGLRRENGLIFCLEMMVYALDHLDHPPPQVVDLRARAAEILEAVQEQIYGGER